MSFGVFFLVSVLALLLVLAIRRGTDFGPITRRLIEQFAILVPRMVCALVAAGFIATLIPKAAISAYLGADAGLLAIPVAAATGLILPAGPVIAFAIAAVFAKAGASTPALVTFITSWSLFAAHRIMIYELPLLGPSFLRLRVVSVLGIPFLAGLLATLMGLAMTFGAATPQP